VNWLIDLASRVRLRVRTFGKNPAFAAVAVLTLGLGIGVCTSMFSVVHAVLIRPLPFREPERLVWIENVFGGGLSGRTSRVDTFNGWREQAKSFESLGAYFAFFDYGRLTLSGAGEPERLRGVGISGNLLAVLGVPLLHGRSFTAEECAWEGPGAALLSHAFWQRRFGGDPGVVGRSIILNDKPTTIVGVLPRTFDFDSIFSPGTEIELITPFPLTPETARWGNTLFGIGRLRPGVTVEQAQAELDVVSERLRETITNAGKFGARVTPLGQALRGRFRSPFLVLAGAVVCVLAIACVNLSNLLLARANVRRQEFAVRTALGATRWHLVELALSESLILAVAGSLIGVPLAIAATRALARLQTFGVPLLQDAAVDPLALVVTVGLTAAAGVACGVLPALHLTRAHRGHVLQQASHQRTASRSSATARNALIVAEVALACVLLVGAGLLFRSFNALLRVSLGFEPAHALAFRVDAPRRFASLLESNQYLDGAVARVAALSGVDGVGLSDCLPLSRNRTWGAGARGVQYPSGQYPIAYPRIVDQNYLQVMRIPLRAGRLFDARDDGQAERVIIINETLAEKLWPGEEAVGRMMDQGNGSRVIGVVADVRHGSLEAASENEMYLNYRQSADWGGMEMVVRSARPPESLVRDVRAALAAYDPSLPTGEYYPLDRLIDNAVAPRRLITRLLGFFSALALALAALGLYGVIAYAVGQRTQEIGIRVAIGARPGDVLGMVLRAGLSMVGLGVVVGLAAALALTRVLQSLLFGVTAHDPLVFGGNAALLVGVGVLACALPALRATRVNPVVALRAD
jgi:predicted permease